MTPAGVAAIAGTTLERGTGPLVAAINAGDLERAARCFTKDASLITPDATAIRGREEVRAILAQLIARGSQIEAQAGSIIVAGEVALGSEHWRIRSAGVEGAVLEQTFSSVWVLRHLEGSWKLAIAAPWGLR